MADDVGTVVMTEVTDEPDIRCYHSRWILTQKNKESATKFDAEIENPILKYVADLDGVVCCSAYPYHLWVTKARLWNWEEIEPHIFIFLTDFFSYANAIDNPHSGGNDDGERSTESR